MEQNNIVQNAQTSLPIKTKIAAWWMIIVGAGLIIQFIIIIVKYNYGYHDFYFIWTITALFFILSIFIMRRKRWAWGWAIVTLLIYLPGVLFQSFVITGETWKIPIAPFLALVSLLYYCFLTAKTSGRWQCRIKNPAEAGF